MWRLFATHHPEFKQALKSAHLYKSPLGVAAKPFLRTDRVAQLRSLLRQQCYVPGVNLSESVKQFARRDEEFNTFLKDFRRKDEPKWRSLMDVKKPEDFKDFAKDFEKTPKQKLDELHMHEQFRKRHIIKEYNNSLKTHSEAETSKMPTMFGDFGLSASMLVDWDEFELLFLDAGTTTNVTSQQRVNQRRILLYMGNCDGIISYGVGKGWEFSSAYDDAVRQLKKNMVAIPLDPFYPCGGYLEYKYHCTTIRIFPAHSGRIKGKPMYVNMLFMAGLRNCQFQVIGRNDDIYPLTIAMYQALLRNTSPKMIAEATGRKVYEMTSGRSTRLKDFGLLSMA